MCEASARYKFGAVRLFKRRSFDILWHSLWIHKHTALKLATAIKGKYVRRYASFEVLYLLGATECALLLHSEPVIDFTFIFVYAMFRCEKTFRSARTSQHLIFVFV